MQTEIEHTSEKVVSYKDTTIFAPKAVASLQIPLSELVLKNDLNATSKPIIYRQKNGQANVKLKIANDSIQVTAICDSLAIAAKIKYQLEKQLKSNHTISHQETLKKRGFTFWNVLLAFVLGSILGFGTCFLLKTIRLV